VTRREDPERRRPRRWRLPLQARYRRSAVVGRGRFSSSRGAGSSWRGSAGHGWTSMAPAAVRVQVGRCLWELMSS